MYASAEQLSPKTHENFNDETRHRNDTVTWLAETLHGSMRTSFDYQFDGQELYAEDGGAMGEVFDSSISTAKQIVELNPNLLFELRRRLIEYDEYQDMIEMSKGELPNTMVVVSDFPEELMTASENVGGYNSGRKQTMLRVISRQANGDIRMVTQSLDGSDRQALEAIYDKLGVTAKPGELLEQRVKFELPDAWQSQLVENLRSTYDQSLTEQYAGNWYAGIKQDAESMSVNTAEFVKQQADLINWFVDEKLNNPMAAEKLRYGLAATITERFNKSFSPESIAIVTAVDYQLSINQYLKFEINTATQRAVQKGETFSGCGLKVSLENDATGQLKESGYGNKTEADTKYNFNKKMYCVVCQAPPKKAESKKPCGPCGICRTCDKKLGGKG